MRKIPGRITAKAVILCLCLNSLGTQGVSAKNIDLQETGQTSVLVANDEDLGEYRNIVEMGSEICPDDYLDDDGNVIDDPYRTKEIMVFGDELKEDYGALEIGKGENVYLLRYKYEYQTKNAYREFVKEYGEENVILNEIFHASQEYECVPVENMPDYDNALYGNANEENDIYDEVKYEGEIRPMAGYYYAGSFTGLDQLRTSIDAYNGNKNNIVVGVIDSGVNTGVAETLASRVITSKCKSYITDSYNTSGIDYMDTMGHGTAVSSIIASCTPSNVKIIDYKVFDGKGNSSMTGLYNAIVAAYNDGVDVLNMSLGGEMGSVSQIEAYFRAMFQRGDVVCVSSGNDGEDGVSANNVYPGSSSNVFCISSHAPEKQNGKYPVSSFACVGSAVDFCALGEKVVSYNCDGYVYIWDGTSFSCPIVASEFASVMTFHQGTGMDYYIDLAKHFISSDFDNDYANNPNYKSTGYGYGYMDFKNVSVCSNGESNCHILWHDEVEVIPDGTLDLVGFQMNTTIKYGSDTVGGVRVVADVGAKLDGKYVTEAGIVYCLYEVNGKTITNVADNDVKVGSKNQYIFSRAATANAFIDIEGITDEYEYAYVQTLSAGRGTDVAYTARYKVRAYAKLEDGTYKYSDTKKYSIYDVSSVLYDNCRMPNVTAHNFLYDNILMKVNPDYKYVSYDWPNVIVN